MSIFNNVKDCISCMSPDNKLAAGLTIGGTVVAVVGLTYLLSSNGVLSNISSANTAAIYDTISSNTIQ